VYFASYKELV